MVHKVVPKSRSNFLSGEHCVTNRTVRTGSQTGGRASRSNSSVIDNRVSGCGDNFLRGQNRSANRAVRTGSQTCFGAGCGNGGIGHWGVPERVPDRVGITIHGSALAGQQINCRRGAGGGRNKDRLIVVLGADRAEELRIGSNRHIQRFTGGDLRARLIVPNDGGTDAGQGHFLTDLEAAGLRNAVGQKSAFH